MGSTCIYQAVTVNQWQQLTFILSNIQCILFPTLNVVASRKQFVSEFLGYGLLLYIPLPS